MKIGIIIPDRGDRPELLENCKRMIGRQTVPVAYQYIVNDLPESEACDITKRYRKAYEAMKDFDVDVIAFIENDDYYADDYLETMVKAWDQHDRPDLFGINYSIYYHLKLRAYFVMRHYERACMMNTLMKPGLKINWPKDDEPYTDIHLWVNQKGITKKLFESQHMISIGMKHGMSMTGGRAHVDRLDRYVNPDPKMYWLRHSTDPESFDFYERISKKLNNE